MELSPLKLISIGVCVLLAIGYRFRKTSKVHIPLMVSAMLIDLALVAYIELTRDAIATAKQNLGPLMVVHILLSVVVLVLYGMQVYSGLRRRKGAPAPGHRSAGLVLLVTRLGNLITSFMVS